MRRYTLPGLSGLSLFILVFGIVTATKLLFANEAVDPFEIYSPLTPGNSSTSLDLFPCSGTVTEDYLPTGWYYCEIRPAKGPIQRVTVAVKDHQIINVIFDVTGLSFGDVAQHWGGPDDVKQIQRSYTAFWNKGIYACSKIRGWFTYLSPVQIVSLRISRPTNSKV